MEDKSGNYTTQLNTLITGSSSFTPWDDDGVRFRINFQRQMANISCYTGSFQIIKLTLITTMN
jgi:hypothetical protein